MKAAQPRPAGLSVKDARAERDQERREAYDQRTAYLATPKGWASARRHAEKRAEAHAARLDRYAHGARGPMAHHHIAGGRIRRAAKAGQRARRAWREATHRGDGRTCRQRRKAAA